MNKIYGVALSPFVRKVLFVLEHKNVEYQMEPVLPFRTPENYCQLHPLEKVPCYQDEYVTLPDSSIICGYLDDKYPQLSVYPRDFRERAKARWYEEYADTEIAELMLVYQFERVVKPTLRRGPADEAKIKRAHDEKAGVICDFLEGKLYQSGFLFSDGLMLADVSIAGIFLSGYYGGFSVCPMTYPKLSAYLQRVWKTPGMQKRIAEEGQVLKAIIQRFPEADVASEIPRDY